MELNTFHKISLSIKKNIIVVFLFLLFFTSFSCKSGNDSSVNVSRVFKTKIEELPLKSYLHLPSYIAVFKDVLITTLNFSSVLFHDSKSGKILYEFKLTDSVYNIVVSNLNKKMDRVYLDQLQFKGEDKTVPFFSYNNIVAKNDSVLIIGVTQKLIYFSNDKDTLNYTSTEFLVELNIINKSYKLLLTDNLQDYDLVTFSSMYYNNKSYFLGILNNLGQDKFAIAELGEVNSKLKKIEIHLDTFLFDIANHPGVNYIFPMFNNNKLENFGLSNLILDNTGRIVDSFLFNEKIIGSCKVNENKFICKLYNNETKVTTLKYIILNNKKILQMKSLVGIENIGTLFCCNHILYNLVKIKEYIILEKYTF